MSDYTLKDLEYWDARIREKVAEFGLDCYPQEFELCDHTQMLGYMAYSGMPSHYPHWSYGKAYEKLKTLYDHGVSGLPYEMVINSNPALGYLMRDNTLCLQILTIAHVYGHNDFFKNNFTFQITRAEFTIGTFKSHAARVRCVRRGSEHRLREGRGRARRRALPVAAVPPEPGHPQAVAGGRSASRLIEAAARPPDPFRRIHRREERARGRPQADAAVARGGPAPLHPRPQPVPRPTGSAICSRSSTRRRSTSSRRSRRRS